MQVNQRIKTFVSKYIFIVFVFSMHSGINCAQTSSALTELLLVAHLSSFTHRRVANTAVTSNSVQVYHQPIYKYPICKRQWDTFAYVGLDKRGRVQLDDSRIEYYTCTIIEYKT